MSDIERWLDRYYPGNVQQTRCPTCDAGPGHICLTRYGAPSRQPHASRVKRAKRRENRRRRSDLGPPPNHDSDQGVSTVLGAVLLLPIMLVMALLFFQAAEDWNSAMRAQSEAAQRAEWCADHPEQEWPGEGSCPDAGPRGWDCRTTKDGTAMVCTNQEADADPTDYRLTDRNRTSRHLG